MKASRLLSLPPYLFEALENRHREALARGRPVINLSIGDPDLSPPESLIDHLERALLTDQHHRYPPQRGLEELKASIRRYLVRRCGVAPDDAEILVLVGSKEGIAHLPWAVCNPGDVALVPDPGYPVYASGAQFAGCRVLPLSLAPARGWLPEMGALPPGILEYARLLILNYPNNPTSATATAELFRAALEIAQDHHLIVANDAAYADVFFDDSVPPLLCGQPDALRRPMVEFFSFSKSFCITGWRIAFAVGNREVIEALGHLKANIDSGVFGAIQEAAARTLDEDGDAFMASMRAEFEKRRDAAAAAMDKLGFEYLPTCATFYVWARVPGSGSAMDYALRMLEAADVLVTPGTGFGHGGEGYFRIALTRPVEILEQAFDRIARL